MKNGQVGQVGQVFSHLAKVLKKYMVSTINP